MRVIVHTSQWNMASRKRNTIGFRTDEQLAEAVKEVLNDSDSDGDNIPEFSSSEESESESANASDRVTFQYRALTTDRQMLPQLQGFLKMIVNQEYHLS